MSGHPSKRAFTGGGRGAAVTVALLPALVPLAALALLGAGCSGTDHPATGELPDGAAVVNGQYLAGSGEFVLQRIDAPVPGYAPLRIDLIGSDLQVDVEEETISLDVALRNQGESPLYAPATVWLAEFAPPGVTVENADVVEALPDLPTFKADPPDTVIGPARWGFDYSEKLGGDPVLEPGETSQGKTWRFHVPGLTGFSFRAWAQFGLVPNRPRLAGLGFRDRNRNGVFDGDDSPHPSGMVTITAPDGTILVAHCGQDGRYAVPVAQAGLYRLLYDPLVRCRCLVDYTTPNPLQVVLPPGPDGRPVSYLHADFGFAAQLDDSIPLPVFFPGPLDSVKGDFYSYLEGRLDGYVLRLRVGFSGCGPDHPFTVYWQWSPVPIASLVPVALLALSHDDLGEMCDAYWERDLAFDLSPVIEAASGSSLVGIHFVDYQGNWHQLGWVRGQD